MLVVIIFECHMAGGMEGRECEECGVFTGGRKGWEGENVRMDRILKENKLTILKVKQAGIAKPALHVQNKC